MWHGRWQLETLEPVWLDLQQKCLCLVTARCTALGCMRCKRVCVNGSMAL